MKLAIAGDSVGLALAQTLFEYLGQKPGLDVVELSNIAGGGTEFYAALADRVATGITRGMYARAILVCGTGIGVCIAANKLPGIHAALAHDTYSAAKAATSNNAQILTMGARVIGVELAKTIADTWLASSFDPDGRSGENVAAVERLDAKYRHAPPGRDRQ